MGDPQDNTGAAQVSDDDLMLLHAYVDGELDEPSAIAGVEARLAEDGAFQAERDELVAARALAREAFEAPAEGVDLSGVFDDVMARVGQLVEAESAAAVADPKIDGVAAIRERTLAAAPPEPKGVLAWLKGLVTFEQPLQSVVAFALVALAVGTLAYSQLGSAGGAGAPAPGAPGTGPAVASAPSEGAEPTDPAGTRRGIELEGRLEGRVESHQIADGDRFRVEFEDDPDTPMVVWHESQAGDGGEGDAPAPDAGGTGGAAL